MKLEARLESLALGGRAAAAGAGGRATPGVVAEAARQFEALLIQQVLKSAHQAGAAIGEAAGALGPYQDLFDPQLALQLSRQGGLGLAQRLA
ncbi:MAG TPA: rod-binding protein, partial [Nevskiaceae bacterium]|nr:rod-binding protein [Nevskiaceae bacterium]